MTAPIADIVPEQRLRESFRKHAALAQLHRLGQWAERPNGGIAGLLDVLHPDATIAIGDLSLKGRDEVARRASAPRRVANRLTSWQGSLVEGGVDLDVLVDHRADRGAIAATARARFDTGGELLPRLRRLDVSLRDAGLRDAASAPLLDSFAENRARSTIHYFIALVEDPARDPEPFFELLAPGYSLHYTPEPVTDAAALRAWVAGALSSVVASEHVIHEVLCRETAPGTYVAEVAMKSQARFPDGSGAISRNKQRWTFVDDATERFARIGEIAIERDGVVFFDADGRQTR